MEGLYAAFTELYLVAKDPTKISWKTIQAAVTVGEFLGKNVMDVLRSLHIMKAGIGEPTLDEAADAFAKAGACAEVSEVDRDELSKAFDTVSKVVFNP